MGETPSKRRCRGYNDFYFGGNPNELNPYKGDAYRAIDWREGWDKAEQEFNARRSEAEELERRRQEPIVWSIDAAEASDDVKEILRRIAEHVGID